MKWLAPWIFLTLYIIALARPLAPLLEYQANRDFFIEVLCINRAKPELKCNGQCALTQKLKEAYGENAQPVSVPSTIKLDDYPVGFISLYKNPKKLEPRLLSPLEDTPFELIAQVYYSKIFHPPTAS